MFENLWFWPRWRATWWRFSFSSPFINCTLTYNDLITNVVYQSMSCIRIYTFFSLNRISDNRIFYQLSTNLKKLIQFITILIIIIMIYIHQVCYASIEGRDIVCVNYIEEMFWKSHNVVNHLLILHACSENYLNKRLILKSLIVWLKNCT